MECWSLRMGNPLLCNDGSMRFVLYRVEIEGEYELIWMLYLFE